MISEARLSQDCYTWLHNTYPALRGCYCLNLNNSGIHLTEDQVSKWIPKVMAGRVIAGVRQIAKRIASTNKSSGLQAGRADGVLYYNGAAHMIEFKIKGGRQSDDQKKWQATIEAQGFRYHLAWSLEEFQELIKTIVE